MDSQKTLDIIRCYKQKMTTRRIAEEVHVSLRDIPDTIKKYEDAKQLLVATGDLPDPSTAATSPRRASIVEAFRQFEKEPSLVKNLIHLNIQDPEQLRKWFADYIDLKGRGKALELFEKLGSLKILAVAESIERREVKGISDEEYVEGLEMERNLIPLRKEVTELRNEKVVLENALPSMREEFKDLNNQLPGMRVEKTELREAIGMLGEYHTVISNLMREAKKGPGYQMAQRLVEDMAMGLLESTIFGDRALIAVRNVIVRDPERMQLLIPYGANSPYVGVSGNFPRELEGLASIVAQEINHNESKLIVQRIFNSSKDIHKRIDCIEYPKLTSFSSDSV